MLAILVFLPFLIVFGLAAVYAERKVSAFIQDRMGPMEVGYYGILQTVADILKLIQKEDIVPTQADKGLFHLAPLLIFTVVFGGFAALPLHPDLIGSGAKVGIFYILAIISLDVIGLLMAGWASNSKYPLIGAVRSVAQIISYEIPMGFIILSVVVVCQTLDLQAISYQQGIWIQEYEGQSDMQNYLFGIKASGIDITFSGGFLSWNIFRVPVLFFSFVLFLIASLAEANRAPFDIPEAESELIGGFHTEYSGLKFGIFFLAEYGMMLLMCFLASILFLGSWNTPLPNIGELKLADWTSGAPHTVYGYVTGSFWLIFKAFLLIFLKMMIRWTYPRLRIDQLMYLCWKVLIPFSLLILFLAAFWKMMM